MLSAVGDAQLCTTCDFTSWPCANCVNAVGTDQDICNSQCGQNVAGGAPTTGLTTTSSLPSGTSVSTIPGGLLPSGGAQATPATNWWRIGIFAAIGIALGVGILHYTRRA
jgi:hypothetical protein